MNEPATKTSHQLVIVARLSEFCQFHRRLLDHHYDPWTFMREKLLQIEQPLRAMKAELLESTRKELLGELAAGPIEEERFSDYKLLFERLVSRSQFVDVAIHLGAAPPPSLPLLRQALAELRPHDVFQEERLPEAQRSPAWERLIRELRGRLKLDLLETILRRKPLTDRRRQMVLRRLRREVAEYCTVVHIPTEAQDTFTPFMLPRIEALVAACLRLLTAYR